MSEFTIQEKAKRYDEAIEKLHEIITMDNKPVNPKEIGEYLFPELKESKDERIRKAILEHIQLCSESIPDRDKWIAWLEKQGQSKKTSIWKHWKNGICGNGEGKPVFLIKSGATYSLSSCLSFECDYIELSELENLILEKQNKQSSNIVWHDVSEEPEEHREIFCEWKGSTDTIWHDVAFYDADTKIFWNGERPISDVIKWAYVDEMLKKAR